MDPFWVYSEQTDEELATLDKWLSGPMQKEIILSDNLWDNMAKVSKKYDIELHPIFAHPEPYIKLARKDVIVNSNKVRDSKIGPK